MMGTDKTWRFTALVDILVSVNIGGGDTEEIPEMFFQCLYILVGNEWFGPPDNGFQRPDIRYVLSDRIIRNETLPGYILFPGPSNDQSAFTGAPFRSISDFRTDFRTAASFSP